MQDEPSSTAIVQANEKSGKNGLHSGQALPTPQYKTAAFTLKRDMYMYMYSTQQLFARSWHSLDLEVLVEFLHDISMLLTSNSRSRKAYGWSG